jgi:hypothetical protein
MKGFSRLFFSVMLTVGMMLVSACGATTQAFTNDGSSGASKPLPSLVSVSGVIEAINGNQWTVNGQIITVDSSMLDDDDDLDDYQVGDYVEIEIEILEDGSLVAREIDDSSDDANSNDDDSSNSNDDDDSNSNDDDSNSNDDDSNSNDDDDSDDDDNENDD